MYIVHTPSGCELNWSVLRKMGCELETSLQAEASGLVFHRPSLVVADGLLGRDVGFAELSAAQWQWQREILHVRFVCEHGGLLSELPCWKQSGGSWDGMRALVGICFHVVRRP